MTRMHCGCILNPHHICDCFLCKIPFIGAYTNHKNYDWGILMKKILLAGLLIFLCSTSSGQTFEEGMLAYYMEDYATAAKIMRDRAKLGHIGAQFFLGKLYASGKGVIQSKQEAINWWSKAADKGHIEAQFNLGSAYNKGEGVSKDHQKAVRWLSKAAENGYAMAQSSLGYSYARGKGVTKDPVEAIKWWNKAADQGEKNAQRLLGLSFASGTGVSQDLAEGYFWLCIAANDDAKFEEARDLIASALAPAKINEIKVRCKKWLKNFDDRK